MEFVRSRMHNGKVGYWEYPLFTHYKLCPSARYVGGTSKYLCECKRPEKCKGVIAVAQENEKSKHDPTSRN